MQFFGNSFHSRYNAYIEFPKCWDWDGDRVKVETPSPNPEDDVDDEDDESSDEEGEPDDEGTEADANKLADSTDSPGYRSFLQFLGQACSGSPIHGYPTVVVIISTIPPSVSHTAFTLTNNTSSCTLTGPRVIDFLMEHFLYFVLGCSRQPCTVLARPYDKLCSIYERIIRVPYFPRKAMEGGY